MPRSTTTCTAVRRFQAAREAALFAYLQFHEPGVLKRDGSNYRHKEHDSLVYVTGKRYWYRNSRGRSINALDYLIQIRGYGLVDAVHTLVGGEIQQAPACRSVAATSRVRKEPEKTIFSPLGQTVRHRCCFVFAAARNQQRGYQPVLPGRAFLCGTVSWRAGLCVCRERRCGESEVCLYA